MDSRKSKGNPAPGFINHPVHRVDLTKVQKRFVGRWGGQVVVDSTRALRMDETGYAPWYYFPREDIRMVHLTPSEHRTYCPFKGYASYWHVEANGKISENAVWSYEAPFDELLGIQGLMAFYPDRLEDWTEQEVFA